MMMRTTMMMMMIVMMMMMIGGTHAQQYTVVSLHGANGGEIMTIRAAAGLMNRQSAQVYTLSGDGDDIFLYNAVVKEKTQPIPYTTFLAHYFNDTRDVIAYDSSATDMLQVVVTLAGVLNAVPVDQAVYAAYASHTHVVFNTTNRWSSVMDAAQYVATNYLHMTTSLAFQNSQSLEAGALVDWIVSQRLFTMYLPHKCEPGHAEHELTKSIVESSPWKRPVKVYGYNSVPQLFGGDLYESETSCISIMGQIASQNSENLAFFNAYGIDTPMPAQTPSSPVVYNASKAYVALVYGDLDNVDFVESIGWQNMVERTRRCKQTPSSCFPLTWTLSPALVDMAPSIMKWYFESNRGNDWFIMPPSGSLYSYPSMFPDDVADDYVEQMHYHGQVMNTTGSIHWEWVFMWQVAIDRYFPRYSGDHQVKLFFLNNVPWVLDQFPSVLLGGKTFEFIGDGGVCVFRPQFNWMYNNGQGGLPNPPDQIAAMINKFAKGSVQYIYIIQNTPVDKVFEMVADLDEHVELVNYEQLGSLAAQVEKRQQWQ